MGLLLAWCVGCERAGSDGQERFVPAVSTARSALDSALTSWQAGRKPGAVAGTSPIVQVVDSKWSAGQKIVGYEVVGEEPGAGPRWFSVRLKKTDPAAEETVRYAVLGQDPLWVYREEDYKRLSGM
jgi:hypothetical protein